MKRALTLLAASVAATGAMAQVTSLLSIPVADMKGVREGEIGYYLSGYEKNIDPRYYHWGYMLVGLHERLEMAASTDFEGFNTWGFKVKAFEDPNGNYALSGGFNYIRGGDSTPFIVGRYNFGDVRLHAGWQRDDRHRLICGVDFPIYGDFSGAIDHTSSDGGVTWMGVFWSVPYVQGLLMNVSLGLPNNKDEGTMHNVGVIYSFRF